MKERSIVNAVQTLETEMRILQTLDRQLLKIADKLDETFDVEDEKAVKMLKLFRSMMTTRRMWAKEYNLVQVPESIETVPEMENVADEINNDPISPSDAESVAQCIVKKGFAQLPLRRKSNNRKKKSRRRR